MAEIRAYAVDCRVSGQVDVGDRRVTDMLNASPEIRFTDARLEALLDGHALDLPELEVGPEELCAVVASGSRGDPARRVRTVAIRIEVDLGPYHVEGAVHGTPASDPLAAALRRAPWVPLTNATVRYTEAGRHVREVVETLVVNRPLATRFQAMAEEHVALPWEERLPGASSAGGHAVELTDI
jgi:hypothetical protein